MLTWIFILMFHLLQNQGYWFNVTTLVNIFMTEHLEHFVEVNGCNGLMSSIKSCVVLLCFRKAIAKSGVQHAVASSSISASKQTDPLQELSSTIDWSVSNLIMTISY